MQTCLLGLKYDKGIKEEKEEIYSAWKDMHKR